LLLAPASIPAIVAVGDRLILLHAHAPPERCNNIDVQFGNRDGKRSLLAELLSLKVTGMGRGPSDSWSNAQ
jgi:hypothetical protein